MIKKCLNIYDKYKEIINYIIVGGIATLISLGSYYLCVLTVFNPQEPVLLQMANIISWILSATFAFWANRIFVFQSKTKEIFKEMSKFYGARVLTLFVDMLVMFLTVTWLGLNDKIMKIVSNIVVLILNYIFSKFLIFVNKN